MGGGGGGQRGERRRGKKRKDTGGNGAERIALKTLVGYCLRLGDEMGGIGDRWSGLGGGIVHYHNPVTTFLAPRKVCYKTQPSSRHLPIITGPSYLTKDDR